MSHEVIEGKDTGWMFRLPAWHDLFKVGHKRPKTIKAAREQSGLTWDVETVPFITMPQLAQLANSKVSGKQLVAHASEFAPANFRAIVRNDTLDTLGVWTDEGVPITNQQGFEFMEAILGQTLFEALFSIRGGRNVCLLSEFPKHVTVGGDQVRQYLYTRLDHTGSGAMQTMCTNVRVQCANTDRMALDDARARDGIYRVRHMGDVKQRLLAAREALDISIDYGKQFKKFGDRLAKQKMAERKLADVVAELWPAASDGKRAVKSASDRQDLVMAIFRGDTAHPKVEHDTTGNAPGTKWCAYNAIVEYQQHYTSTRVSKDTADPERKRAEQMFVRSTDDPQGVQAKALELVTAA